MPPYPWQTDVWAGFVDNVFAKRLAHALLVTGADGLGMDSLAYAMARYLLCQSPLEDVACGRCRGCQLFQAGSHPDFRVLQCEEGSQNIKVDQVRGLMSYIAKTAHFDGVKVALVREADTMNINAANALLKSLEEPSGETVFLLVSHRPYAILPTIRSRCQTIKIAVPTRQLALTWLNEQEVVNPELWLDEAGGAPIKAKLWAVGDYARLREELLTALSGFVEDRLGTMQLAAKWAKSDVELLISLQLSVLDQLLKARLAGQSVDDSYKGLARALRAVEASALYRMRDKLQSTLSQWHQMSNLNLALVCEELAMDWHALFRWAKQLALK